MSSWRNRLARSTVNREVVGSIPTEDALFSTLSLLENQASGPDDKKLSPPDNAQTGSTNEQSL